MRAGRRGDRVELTIGPRPLRGGVAAAEAPPARPTLGGSRSFERGCTGRAGRCRRPRRRFGFRRRRAPSVRRRRRGVGHCASAPPCLDCSPTPARQTLLGLAITRRSGSLWWRRVGCRLLGPLVCGAGRQGWVGLAGRGLKARAFGACGVVGGRAGRAGLRPVRPDRGAGRGCTGPPASPRVARPSIRAGVVAWTRGVVCLGGRQ